jgi:hypothetical protein
MLIQELFESTTEKKTLYCSRNLLNGADLVKWAKEQGFEECLDPKDMHVTVAYSKKEIDWTDLKAEKNEVSSKVDKNHPAKTKREIKAFGEDKKAIVLTFRCPEIEERWKQFREDFGASWDFDDYHPHISITYNGLPKGVDLKDIEPYEGDLKFGDEHVQEVDTGWKGKTKEKKLTEADMYFVQPDGSWKKNADHRSPGKSKEEVKKIGGKIVEARGESKLPPQVIAAFEKLGDMQRGPAETAMLRVQHQNLGGVLSPVVEHTGDLVHRMSHLADHGVFDYDIGNKVNRVLRYLEHDYGFAREHAQNIKNNAEARGGEEKHQADLTTKLRAYAEEHAKLPSYNRAQYLANRASIAVGLQQWDKAIMFLHELKAMVDSPEGFAHFASQYKLDSQGNVLPYPWKSS